MFNNGMCGRSDVPCATSERRDAWEAAKNHHARRNARLLPPPLSDYSLAMQFGPVSLSLARGAILVHSVRAGSRLLRKGRTLTSDDIVDLERTGHTEITIARLEAGDIGEDEAAARIAEVCKGGSVRASAPFTGRVNLYAEASGVASIDAAKVAAINEIDESVTVATLAPFTRVAPGQMLATVKIIPFGAPRSAVEGAERIGDAGPFIRVAPFAKKRVALISTVLANTRQHVLDKNVRAIEIRLDSLGSSLAFQQRVAHDEAALSDSIAETLGAGADLVLVFGASAITDRRDVIPAAILRAGGTIRRFGMPVDPGNLLLLGEVHRTTIVGLPGCARSPKRNGFDFVLERILAGVPVRAIDIAAMGVGGLLSEIPTRPQLRDSPSAEMPRAPVIAAIVLAAGLASRMGHNKLTATLGGKPLLRHAVDAALASHASRVIVVTGNAHAGAKAALTGLPVQFVHNADFRAGLSTSLKTGIRAVPDDFDGAIVLLGDMPGIGSALINSLIAAFSPEESRAIVVATHGGKRGNPILWARQFFADILTLEGDVGAKHLIAANDESVCEVEAPDDGPLVDIDTPDALNAYGARQR
jgi:molybdenum cofactor cytidylyltransferase